MPTCLAANALKICRAQVALTPTAGAALLGQELDAWHRYSKLRSGWTRLRQQPVQQRHRLGLPTVVWDGATMGASSLPVSLGQGERLGAPSLGSGHPETGWRATRSKASSWQHGPSRVDFGDLAFSRQDLQ